MTLYHLGVVVEVVYRATITFFMQIIESLHAWLRTYVYDTWEQNAFRSMPIFRIHTLTDKRPPTQNSLRKIVYVQTITAATRSH